MTFPDFASVMLSLLRIAADGRERYIDRAAEQLATELGLSPEERSALIPGGGRTLFFNDVLMARVCLKWTGLLDHPQRGTFRITDRGVAALEANPFCIDPYFFSDSSWIATSVQEAQARSSASFRNQKA